MTSFNPPSFLEVLQKKREENTLSFKEEFLLKEFFFEYLKATEAKGDLKNHIDHLFTDYLHQILENKNTSLHLSCYHEKVREPFDYFSFGQEMIRPLIDFSSSKIWGKDVLKRVDEVLQENGNVIFLANHQTEPDPQIISLLLEKENPYLSKEMIFVAGSRVTTDPMAIPFSLGRNLLCIYSKKYLSHPLEDKERKQRHNQRTMLTMAHLMKEGKKAIFVAPSGGRDRKENGVLAPAPFDQDSLEMFYLMAKKSNTLTLFVPLALYSYPLLPPPESIQHELGEKRTPQKTPIYLGFGHPFTQNDLSLFSSKEERKKHFMQASYEVVKELYGSFFSSK